MTPNSLLSLLKSNNINDNYFWFFKFDSEKRENGKLIIVSTLMIGINTKYFCDSNGNRIFPKSFSHFIPPKEPEAYIKHFYTKTAEEFCNKINKGDGHYHKSHPERINVFKKRINLFFIYNSIRRKICDIQKKISR